LISSTTCCAGRHRHRTIERRADVVDQDLGALLRHQHCDGAADAAAGPGDDGDFVFNDSAM